jgi:ribulose 1,5-bisphosphate synthetase/thiazole synthase
MGERRGTGKRDGGKVRVRMEMGTGMKNRPDSTGETGLKTVVVGENRYTRDCPVLWDMDVLVVGGGSAGTAAAVAAARTGARVALVDRASYLGGTGASVLDTFYGFYCPGQSERKVVGGIPDEVVSNLEERKAAIKRPSTYGAGTGITYHPDLLKVVWEELATKAGVRVLLHTYFLDTIMKQGAVRGAVVANKRGLWQITARVVVDASGDGDVAYRAGAEYEDMRAVPVQSLTTTFRLGNVDVERAQAVKKSQLWGMMSEAASSGEYRLPRIEGSVHVTPYPGIMATNMVRLQVEDPTDPIQISGAEIEGRRQALEYHRFLRDCVPGYEESVLLSFSTYIGVRESRRILGEYWLTREDVLSARKFEDAVAMCGAPIEEHHAGADTRWEYLPEGTAYDIPYRTLLPRGVEGLVIAGRCLSASHDAHASVRSMGQCMALGQAAGLAAAQAACAGRSPREIDVRLLQRDLLKLGAVLEVAP